MEGIAPAVAEIWGSQLNMNVQENCRFCGPTSDARHVATAGATRSPLKRHRRPEFSARFEPKMKSVGPSVATQEPERSREKN